MPAVSRATLAPFVGPVAVLYLIAAAASLPGAFSITAWVVAAVAALLSMTPAIAQRHADAAGSVRVGWLGLMVAIALSTTLSPQTGVLWTLELARVVAFPTLAILLVDLALGVPVPIRDEGFARVRLVAATIAVVGALLSVVEAILPLSLGGVTLLLPSRWSRAPEVVAALGVLGALLIRTSRARAGGRAEALAENAWAQLGLLPSSVLAVLTLWSARNPGLDLTQPWFSAALCLGALVLVRAHVLLVDARYRLHVGNTARHWIAVTLVVAVVSVLAVALRARIPTAPLDLAVWVAVASLLAMGAYSLLSRLLRAWLAPARGALLDALDQAAQRLCDVASLSDVGAAVLPPLRAASGTTDGLVLLYAFDPAVEVSIDAAGQPRLGQPMPPQALSDQVHQYPHDIIVRRPLEDALVRRAEVRPLVDALQRLDALCVIPLRNQSELEGMLVLPRGLRHASLSLEELSALDRFAALLSAFVAVISREARAGQRLNEVIVAGREAEQRIAAFEQENARLMRHERALAQQALRPDVPAPIAYGPKMRALCERLAQLAVADVPVMLRVPLGTDLDPLIRFFHQQSGRGDQALVVVDCAALSPSTQQTALFGSDDPAQPCPGHLRLAQGGTLVLLDLPALSHAVQTELLSAIVRKRMRPRDGALDLPVNVRVLCTSRVDLSPLVDQGRFDAELGARLSPVTLVVPGLRDRREDLQSLILLALDRAARIHGRDVLGIEPDAMQALLDHRYVGNDAELAAVIDRAVSLCSGERIGLAHLKLPRATGSPAPSTSPLSGTFDTVEKRALKHALTAAHGNKSEAARLLGLKRTTFLDKLRRHGLDDSGSPSVSS